MYDVVVSVLGRDVEQIVPAICGALICLLTVVFIDFIKDIISGFFRG